MRGLPLFLAAVLTAACVVPMAVPPGQQVSVQLPATWRAVPASQWPLFHDELTKESLRDAAKRSVAYLAGQPTGLKFNIGDREVSAGDLQATIQDLSRLAEEAKDDNEFNVRLHERFDLFQSVGSDGSGKVVFSAYYQPTLPASLKKTATFRYPLYRKPKDLVSVDLGAFGLAGDPIAGRIARGNLVPYYSRREIDGRKGLAGKGLELAWLDNDFDRLTLHIEGSGILRFEDGREALAKFAATNALPFKSVGTVVVGSGALAKSEITHASLRRYLLDHPEGAGWILSQDPRYTFFDLAPLVGDAEPAGTMGQPLTPGRSIAIDPKLVPLGAIVYFETSMPQADERGRLLGVFPASRFVLCQDTGGAIQGPGRVDIFVGHGREAEVISPNQWAEGRLFLFLKKA